MLTIGSMFSGYGGLDLAVEAATGAKLAWVIEIEPAPAKVLTHHWPHAPNLGDVTKVDWANTPDVDILTAGYPCQPFSQAGKRKGTNDTRHLWPHVREAVRHLRPKILFMENVAGHRSLGLDRVLGDLAEDGMHAQWTSIRASDVGAPHHRERLFILAVPADSNGLRLEEEQQPGGPGQKITGHHDREYSLAWIGNPTDLSREMKLRYGTYWQRIVVWALITGTQPPPPVITQVDKKTTVHPRFPETREAANPEFVEWMMGLPPGWVTDVPGVTHTQKIKMLGNGVCPQQAIAAFRDLMAVSRELQPC